MTTDQPTNQPLPHIVHRKSNNFSPAQHSISNNNVLRYSRARKLAWNVFRVHFTSNQTLSLSTTRCSVLPSPSLWILEGKSRIFIDYCGGYFFTLLRVFLEFRLLLLRCNTFLAFFVSSSARINCTELSESKEKRRAKGRAALTNNSTNGPKTISALTEIHSVIVRPSTRSLVQSQRYRSTTVV